MSVHQRRAISGATCLQIRRGSWLGLAACRPSLQVNRDVSVNPAFLVVCKPGSGRHARHYFTQGKPVRYSSLVFPLSPAFTLAVLSL